MLAPSGKQTRPILDRVKGAVFDILGSRLALPGVLPPLTVLDLFAGTGSLGLEAMSRGASFCAFVEKHQETAQRLADNIAKLRAQQHAQILQSDAWNLDFDRLESAEPFGLVFVDPPYRDAGSLHPSTPIAQLMHRLSESSKVAPNTIIVLRHPKRSLCGDETFECCRLTDQRTYGKMTISFLETT